uniref:Probable imidazolonepropionase n=1 Tax=Ditylenchus dipsaci TaxID=166011 RepID=A0A915E3L3_9BILA
MKNIKVLTSDDCLLAILCKNGKIAAIERSDKFDFIKEHSITDRLDCGGGCVLPGLVDGHTHPVFAGDRVHEFSMKLAGATYMDVQAAGGGIHFTTQKTREATEDSLLQDFLGHANQMLACGTTLLEAKSGYGLNLESELKMLHVLDKAQQFTPLEISATFCGAHAIPAGSTEQQQTKLIVEQIIPELDKRKRLDNQFSNLENIDVFCEKNVFEIETSKKILQAGQKIGLKANFHADELHPLGGTELASEIKATAASHLEEISEAGINALADAGTVAVLLPTTAYILRLKPPPARQMIERGVCVALGSDFNPNAFCYSMPTVMNLACVTFKMSMSESLVGRVADLVVLGTSSWEHLIYRLGCHNPIITHVIKSSQVAYKK